eukprot:CAMPEP_0177582380 /NCGR_PEP_ID=MMETSP0419_2-20121207/2706_1 /TAXON_ID=582737 /ORGANISM="Tetraselmis sp., Strain GSL018" /LENGTH=178 /DNA_ID=CAMNT_0019071597 /DNA_START=591 /DNA_END=1127 /DNA_ORIENTATION=-
MPDLPATGFHRLLDEGEPRDLRAGRLRDEVHALGVPAKVLAPLEDPRDAPVDVLEHVEGRALREVAVVEAEDEDPALAEPPAHEGAPRFVADHPRAARHVNDDRARSLLREPPESGDVDVEAVPGLGPVAHAAVNPRRQEVEGDHLQEPWHQQSGKGEKLDQRHQPLPASFTFSPPDC